MIQSDLGLILLYLARESIAAQLGLSPTPSIPDLAPLQAHGATFVTLTHNNELRGCIGSLQARRPLVDDVCANACAAAFHDPRFSPLSQQELPYIVIEISLLSEPELLQVRDEPDLLRQVQAGQDGLIVEDNGHRATFLPQVWEKLPAPALFISQLRHKAGLPADHWSETIRWFRYTVQKWQEVR